MDISAHAISLADRCLELGHSGHQFSHEPGRPIFHRRLILSQTSAGCCYVVDSSPTSVPLFVPDGRSFVPVCTRRRAARKGAVKAGRRAVPTSCSPAARLRLDGPAYGARIKRLHRERRRLIAERVQHVNRIKGLCATQGIYDYSPLRKDRLARIDVLRTGDGRALPMRLKAEIVRELRRLELVMEMIATVEAERDAILTNPASTHVNAGKIK